MDYLIMDMGTVAEKAAIPAAVNVGEMGFRPGYQLRPGKRSVHIYYLVSPGNSLREFDGVQKGFVARIEPLMVARFGCERVRRVRSPLDGVVYLGVEVMVR